MTGGHNGLRTAARPAARFANLLGMDLTSQARFAFLIALIALCALPSGAAGRGPTPPAPVSLSGMWEISDTPAAEAPTQPVPPDEDGGGQGGGGAVPARARGAQAAPGWRPARVPGVFDPDAAAALYPGTVKQYRLRFRAPSTKAFGWAVRFEQVRRTAKVYLNGRYIGANVDPYTPFEVEAEGLRRGELNELLVTVDSRKDPRLVEGWWNWGGITRPVSLVPRGKSASLRGLGLMSDVKCTGPATGCRAELLVDGILQKLPAARRPAPQPTLAVRLRSPSGTVTNHRIPLTGSRFGRRRVNLSLPVPTPELWSPERPALYDARVSLSYGTVPQQVERMQIGLRSVTVKNGLLHLNNRPIRISGASIHEDFPGHGAALTGADMDTIVRELKEVGANLTRSHYVLSEGLLRRLDRAGIMVWNQAPVWQRDFRPNLLAAPADRAFALNQVSRTVKAARNHPSVITHSVANELAFTADRQRPTRTFTAAAKKRAEDLDPTLPISIDQKGRAGYGEQFAYGKFELLGINQYYGWYVPAGYTRAEDFALLDDFLLEMRDNYPTQAIVMTEFGAEGRPDMANAPAEDKGSYALQANFVDATLDVTDRLPFLSGSIHWTLREFEIYPGWRGGALPGPGRNTRHHKGVLTYDGARKPVWRVLREHFLNTPLYRR
ncbi:MAG: glycoside hydrolase family 2 TIM barrel-domain containing protein [Thermoleophilaceae bacterium]